jgi:hypothetical protein
VFSVKDARIDPGRREIVVGEVSTDRGRISIRRGADGRLNLARLVPDAGAADARGKAQGPEEKASGKKAAGGNPWSVTLKKTSLDRYVVRFDDASTIPAVALSLDGMRLRAENATTEKNRKGTFSLSTGYGGQGKLSLGGSFSLDPLSMAGRLKAARLPLGLLQPYWTESVKVLVSDGDVSAEGAVRVSAQAAGRLRAEYKGKTSVNRFDSWKASGEEFLKFDTLHFGGIDVSWQPTNVVIREIALSNFYSRIVVNEDGSLNVQGIVAKEGAADNAGRGGGGAGRGGEGREGGSRPGPGADRQRDAAGRGRLLQRPVHQAELLREPLGDRRPRDGALVVGGDAGRRGPAREAGGWHPTRDHREDQPPGEGSLPRPQGRLPGHRAFALDALFRQVRRYGIEKGKLTLNLAYHIENKKLDAQNKVFIDQFTFGERVDSPDATKLPVKLAVSLLKDRKGEIRLDLPVSGRIDDPKFSVWKIIWKIVGNLLVKAATAPFALIGAMFGGGGEELAYLEFEPGSSVIPPAGAAKIGNLAKALYDRPACGWRSRGTRTPSGNPRRSGRSSCGARSPRRR